MTRWYEYDRWWDDKKPEAKKVHTLRNILHFGMVANHEGMWIMKLDCGHFMVETVPNNGIPKGLNRECKQCQKL